MHVSALGAPEQEVGLRRTRKTRNTAPTNFDDTFLRVPSLETLPDPDPVC